MPQVPQQTKLLNPKINWGNPITHGLVFDVPLWEGTGNIAEDDANLLGFLGTFKN